MIYYVDAAFSGWMIGMILCQISRPRWKWWLTSITCMIIFLIKEYYSLDLNIMKQVGAATAAVFLISLVMQKDHPATRLMAAGTALFIVFSSRYVMQYIVSQFANRVWYELYTFIFLDLSYEAYRVFMPILIVVQVLLFLLLRCFLASMRKIEILYQLRLAGVMAVSCQVITHLIWGINRNYSVVITQGAISMALGFIILSCILFTVMLSRSSALRVERKERELMDTVNRAAREGYRSTVQMNRELRSQAHDFKNHLLAMQNMNEDEFKVYIKDLLKKQPRSTRISQTGDAYIDAVISSKMTLMEKLKIHYEQNVRYPGIIHIPPTDLCAIVANQLDNAIEACEKIEDPDKRWIQMTIDKKGSMIGILCENSILPGSVTEETLMTTTKNKDHQLHGFGIANIRYCAKKNQGILLHETKEDRFLSKVLLQEADSDLYLI